MTDEFFNHMTSQDRLKSINELGEKEYDKKPGLIKLHTVKMNFLELVNDMSVQRILETSEVLEHLELTGVKNLTEYFVDKMMKNYFTLKFVDLQHVPIMTPQFYEQMKEIRPDLLQRRYKISDVDPKDNMLRVPLRIKDDGKKKKKKKGGKKKK